MVLGAAEALRALAVRRGGRVDVLRDVGAADEADGLDVGVVEQRVDGFLVALHHLEHAGREAGLEEQFGQPHRHRGVALGGLEDEGVAACQGGAGLPQRDHRREVERGDAGDHAERLADRVDVDAATGALGELALEQVRDADGELDDLDAALDVAVESGTVLPCSMDSSSASSSTLALTSSTNFIRTRARRCGFNAAHSFCASTAEATAVSTSAADARSTWACTSPVLGLKTSAVRVL